jgi:hypothetical protein
LVVDWSNVLVLEDKDILHVDATIITGILILLTLSNVGGVTAAAPGLAAVIAGTTVPLFGVSSILILLSRVYAGRPLGDKIFGLGAVVPTASGIAWLIIILVWFFYISRFAPSLFNELRLVR